MNRRFAILAALALSGCVGLLPPASEQIAGQLNQAVAAIDEVSEAAAIPYADRSFAAMQTRYIRALSSLRGALRAAEQRAQYGRGKPFSRPARISVEAVGNCVAAVRGLMEINRDRAIDERDVAAVPVQAICTVPKLIEGDLKRGG